jgi:hypothetical protein
LTKTVNKEFNLPHPLLKITRWALKTSVKKKYLSFKALEKQFIVNKKRTSIGFND